MINRYDVIMLKCKWIGLPFKWLFDLFGNRKVFCGDNGYNLFGTKYGNGIRWGVFKVIVSGENQFALKYRRLPILDLIEADMTGYKGYFYTTFLSGVFFVGGFRLLRFDETCDEKQE